MEPQEQAPKGFSKKTKIILAVAAVVLLSAFVVPVLGLGMYARYLDHQEPTHVRNKGPKVEVTRAKRTIPAGTVLTKKMVLKRRVLAKVIAGDDDLIHGQSIKPYLGHKVTVTIYRGTLFRKSHFVKK